MSDVKNNYTKTYTDLMQQIHTRLLPALKKNLRSLKEAMGWTQSNFAAVIGVCEGAMSNYLKLDKEEIPSLDRLLLLCRHPDVKKKGIMLSLEQLISEDFRPLEMMQHRSDTPSASVAGQDLRHGDMFGAFLVYFFDQSKLSYEEADAPRPLRFGVISLFDSFESVSGEASYKAIGLFFKPDEWKEALELKTSLDAIWSSDMTRGERNDIMKQTFLSASTSIYEGNVEYRESTTWIQLKSDMHDDVATIVLPAPRKKADAPYIGGLGAVLSLSHGSARIPVAQKILFSKHEILRSDEHIGDLLGLAKTPLWQESEAEKLCEFTRKLYSADGIGSNLEEADKAALVRRRMDHLVRHTVNKLGCVTGITPEDDDNAYELIKKFRLQKGDFECH